MRPEPTTTSIDDATYQLYLSALLGGDRARCTQVVQDLVAAKVDPKVLYVDLFQRALYQVGDLWERQRISVAVEHLATATTERMLTLVYPMVFSGPPRERSIVVACVADEYHQLGARMIADFCEMRRWRAYFLGPNTPLPDLLQLLEQRRPTLLGLSLSIFFNLPALLTALDAITARVPDLPILVGGQAFRWGGLAALQAYPSVTHVATLDELERRLMVHEQ